MATWRKPGAKATPITRPSPCALRSRTAWWSALAGRTVEGGEAERGHRTVDVPARPRAAAGCSRRSNRLDGPYSFASHEASAAAAAWLSWNLATVAPFDTTTANSTAD